MGTDSITSAPATAVGLGEMTMSLSHSEPFHVLEFRHGPMSVCEPGMLVIGILAGETAEAEGKVLDEAAGHGADVWRLGPGDPGGHLGPIARLPLQLYPLQAFALSLSLRRGLDPVAPRHLNQVVVLGEV